MSLEHYGGFVSVDWEIDGSDVEPLLWCLRFALSDDHPLDRFLPGIMGGDDLAPCGGDPGWVMYAERCPDGIVRYCASTDPNTSYLDPCEGMYEVDVVKRLIRRTLENLRASRPERSNEVSEIMAKYQL